jgi:hypothetical protein
MIRADYRDMNDDEKEIAKGHGQGQMVLLVLLGIPAAALWFGDDKFAYWFGFAAIIYLLNEACGRLLDLSVRVSRTNELLVDGRNERRYRKDTA